MWTAPVSSISLVKATAEWELSSPEGGAHCTTVPTLVRRTPGLAQFGV